jgi:hypothetical protein
VEPGCIADWKSAAPGEMRACQQWRARAECHSATRQITNLRYKDSHLAAAMLRVPTRAHP